MEVRSNFQHKTPKVGAPSAVLGFGQNHGPLSWFDNGSPQSKNFVFPLKLGAHEGRDGCVCPSDEGDFRRHTFNFPEDWASLKARLSLPWFGVLVGRLFHTHWVVA